MPQPLAINIPSMRNPSNGELADLDKLRLSLLGSFTSFIHFFFPRVLGREYVVNVPPHRRSHYLEMARVLTGVIRGYTTRLYIGVPPRYGKTTEAVFLVAWGLAHNPAAANLYISYGKELAATNTALVREIVSHPDYSLLFGVTIKHDTDAKSYFVTSMHGSVYAAGTRGAITGFGAGIRNNTTPFGGLVILDDTIKPEEAGSDIIREGVNKWYHRTLRSRLNDGERTPIVYIGQRTHEDDLPGNLLSGFDGTEWESLIMPALDEDENPLDPTLHSKEYLLNEKKYAPYVFAAQYQQDPQPPGGSIFKKAWFALLDVEPTMGVTFITADCAETEKEINDATVFSFWGLYPIQNDYTTTGLTGLHCIASIEIWVQPYQLEKAFKDFWVRCMRHPVQPSTLYIEKKSTGTTLLSVAEQIQGLYAQDVPRKHPNKTDRFLAAQRYVTQHLVSFTRHAPHADLCIDHMAKITGNNSHKRDDIADTVCDAISLVFIQKIVTLDSASIHSQISQEELNAMHRHHLTSNAFGSAT